MEAAEQIAQEVLRKKYRDSSKFWFRRFGVLKNIEGVIARYPNIKLKVVQERIFDYNDECLQQKKPCLIATLKPRKEGASTGIQAAMYHRLRQFPGRSAAVMGDIIGSSDTVMEIFRTFAENDTHDWGDGLPNLAPGDRVNNLSDDIVLPNMATMKKVTAGSTNANRSGTLQILNATEVAYYPTNAGRDPLVAFLGSWHEHGAASFAALDTTSAGPVGKFYELYMDPRNSWKKIFVSWFEEPDHVLAFSTVSDEEKFKRSMDRLEHETMERFSLTLPQLNWRRDKLYNKCGGSIEQLNREYPPTVEDAFNQKSALRFNIQVLETMERRAKVVVPRVGDFVTQANGTVSFVDDPNGTVKIFEEPRFGCKYMGAVDPCSGKDQQSGNNPDAHAVGILRADYIDPRNADKLPDMLVATHHSRLPVEAMCDSAAALSRYYGNCMMAVETNGVGLFPVKKLKELNVPLWQRKLKEGSNGGQMADGWYSNESLRKTIIDHLGEVISKWRLEEPTIDIFDADVLAELKTMVVDGGRAEAMPGKHDDLVLMLAILYFLRTNATLMKEPERKKVSLAKLLAREGWRSLPQH
jgi:hypothetical protein